MGNHCSPSHERHVGRLVEFQPVHVELQSPATLLNEPIDAVQMMTDPHLAESTVNHKPAVYRAVCDLNDVNPPHRFTSEPTADDDPIIVQRHLSAIRFV